MKLTPEQVDSIRELLEDSTYGSDAPKLCIGQVRHCQYVPGGTIYGKDDYEFVVKCVERPLAFDVLDVLSGNLKVKRPKVKKQKGESKVIRPETILSA